MGNLCGKYTFKSKIYAIPVMPRQQVQPRMGRKRAVLVVIKAGTHAEYVAKTKCCLTFFHGGKVLAIWVEIQYALIDVPELSARQSNSHQRRCKALRDRLQRVQQTRPPPMKIFLRNQPRAAPLISR